MSHSNEYDKSLHDDDDGDDDDDYGDDDDIEEYEQDVDDNEGEEEHEEVEENEEGELVEDDERKKENMEIEGNNDMDDATTEEEKSFLIDSRQQISKNKPPPRYQQHYSDAQATEEAESYEVIDFLDLNFAVKGVFVQKASGIFQNLQRNQLTFDDAYLHYKALLEDCVKSIPKTESVYHSRLELNLSCLQFAHAIFSSSLDGKSCHLIPNLLLWVNEHRIYPQDPRELNAISQMNFREDSLAWNYILRLLLRGNPEVVVKLLDVYFTESGKIYSQKSHENAEDSPYFIIRELLSTYPKVKEGAEVNFYKQDFLQWKEECEETLAVFEQELLGTKVLQLLEILSGNEDTIRDTVTKLHDYMISNNHKQQLTSIWLDVAIAVGVYCKPYTNYILDIVDLEDYQVPTDNHKPFEEDDDIYFHLLQVDIQSLEFFDVLDPFISCHLVDLLSHSQKFPMSKKIMKQRTDFTIRYAKKILNIYNNCMWSIALDYLKFCPSRDSFEVIGQMVNKQTSQTPSDEMPTLSSEFKVERLILALKSLPQLGFEEEPVMELCKQVRRSYAEKLKGMKGRIVSSIHQYLLADNPQLALELIDNVMEAYIMKGEGVEDIQSIGDCVESIFLNIKNKSSVYSSSTSLETISRIAYIHNYGELLRAWSEKKLKKTGQLILSLLAANKTPRRFWIVLLMHCCPLLQYQDELIFDREQTYFLMDCLGELSQSYKKSYYFKDVPIQDISFINTCLLRNLSRAVLFKTN